MDRLRRRANLKRWTCKEHEEFPEIEEFINPIFFYLSVSLAPMTLTCDRWEQRPAMRRRRLWDGPRLRCVSLISEKF